MKNDLLNALLKFADDNEKIFLPILSLKFASAVSQYPEDQMIGIVAGVISRMANNDKMEMSRAEFKDLYEKFYQRNSKFASLFNEELGIKEETVQVKEVDNDGSLLNLQVEQFIDPVIASSYNQLFGIASKKYSEQAEKAAVATCSSELKLLGLPAKVSLLDGKEDVIICSATFETPRGSTSVLIPLELIDGKVLPPTIFVGNHGPVSLHKDAIISYLRSEAGNVLKTSHQEVLQATLMARGNSSEISGVDLAFIKLAASEEEGLIGQQIMGVSVETENKNLVLDMPEIKDEQMESLSAKFETALGKASFAFGNQVIRQGRALINKVIAECNATANIAVSSSSEDELTYAVSLNGGSAGIIVPVRVSAGCALPPETFLSSGTIRDFDKTNLLEVLRGNNFDRRAAVAASPLYGLRPADLVQTVRQAMDEENYAKAEDALNVLSEMEDKKAYEIALASFSSGLLKKEAEPEVKCSMIVRGKHSQYDLCGHTGLPTHKVFQNKRGECLPLYRQSMSEDYENAILSNHKVFF